MVRSDGAPYPDDTEAFADLGKRLPVISVGQESGSWAVKSLLQALRGFLLGSGKADRR
jgi:hypothetical protein